MSLTQNPAGTAPAEAAAWANDANAPARPSIVRLAWNAALPKSCSKVILMCLAYHACKNERDECFPHVATLARLCNMHPRTASQHLKALALAGLIAVMPRFNSSSVYRLSRGRLSALSSERVADATDPVQNLLILDPVIPALDPAIPASRPGDSCTHKGEEEGLKEEGRGSARPMASDLVEPAFSPLPVFEDPKTEQPQQPVITELIDLATPVLDAAVLAELDAARADFGMDPLTPSDCADLADSAAAVGVTPTTLAGWKLGELRAAEPLVDAATLAAVNAQRVTNGKREPVNLGDLVEQARLVGLTPAAAAQWILAKPTRTFLLARYYRPDPAQAAPIDEADKARTQASADAVQAALLRRSIEAMRAPVLVSQPAARPIGAAVTLRQRAPVSVGASTGTGWAHAAVTRFTTGQTLSRATITSAAVALGLSLSDLKAQRAAHLAQGAAA